MNLSASELTNQLKELLVCERSTLAEFVLKLAEIDRCKLYLELGYASLWDYCRRALGLSDKATYHRIAAARVVQNDPELAQLIRDGRLCITTLATLSKVLTQENCESLVAEAAGKSTREVERLVARLDPKPVPADVARPVADPLSARKVETEVLTETQLRKHIAVDREYEDLLEAARDALSHSNPGASELAILKDGLRRIIRDAEKRKGILSRPKREKTVTDGNIPRSVEREVWKRDDGRCQWRTDDGEICGSTRRIEFHHRRDRGNGGRGTKEKVMLLCGMHTQFAADIAWSEDFMERLRQADREPTSMADN